MAHSFVQSTASPGDYFQLMKPRLMSLVIFTAAVGMYLAPGVMHPAMLAISIFAIALGAGSAGALNMWYEHDIDAVMPRTKNRPIPAGRIHPDDALAFGVITGVSAVMILGFAANYLAASLLAFAISFYLFIYTILLKRRSAHNVVISGACGAIPPMIGWSSVTNSITIEPILLFLLVFIWQAPHFWALLLFQQEGYAKAKIPMLSTFATKKQILFYTLAMNVSVFLPLCIGMFSGIYGAVAIVTTVYFNERVWRLWKSSDPEEAKKLFWYSISYLFLLFMAMIADHTMRIW